MPSPLFCCHLSLCVKKRSVMCHSQITRGTELCFQLPVLLPGCCGAQSSQGPWRAPGLCSFPFSGSEVQDCGIHHIQLMQDSSAEGCSGKTALWSDCVGRVMHKEWAEDVTAYFKEFLLWFVNIFLKRKKEQCCYHKCKFSQ